MKKTKGKPVLSPLQLAQPNKKVRAGKIKLAIALLNDIVKVKIGPSKIHGVGLFAMRDIKKGEVLNLNAVFHAFDVPYKDFKKLRPEVSQLLLERWPLVTKGSHFYYPDTQMSAYMNHSETPNYDGKTDKTLKKIKKGEEITEDYRQIEGWEVVYPWLKGKKGL
jgi:hypothetical protein